MTELQYIRNLFCKSSRFVIRRLSERKKHTKAATEFADLVHDCPQHLLMRTETELKEEGNCMPEQGTK